MCVCFFRYLLSKDFKLSLSFTITSAVLPVEEVEGGGGGGDDFRDRPKKFIIFFYYFFYFFVFNYFYFFLDPFFQGELGNCSETFFFLEM